MKKVTIDGVLYLGNLKELDDGKYVLKGAMRTDKVNRSAFISYLKKKNMGTLEPVEFGGLGTSFSVEKLNPVDKLNLSMCKLAMNYAKEVAAAGTENKVFEDITEKR